MENSAVGAFASLLLTVLYIAALVLISLLVAKDAAKHRIPLIEKDYRSSDQTLWFFTGLLTCLLGWLYYAYRRGLVMAVRTDQQAAIPGEPAPAPQPSLIDRFFPPAFPPRPVPQPTPAISAGEEGLEARLENLQKLKEKGLITEEEWQQKKRQLLGL